MFYSHRNTANLPSLLINLASVSAVHMDANKAAGPQISSLQDDPFAQFGAVDGKKTCTGGNDNMHLNATQSLKTYSCYNNFFCVHEASRQQRIS